MFPLEWQKRHPDRQERESKQETMVYFTVFKDAYSAIVSGDQI